MIGLQKRVRPQMPKRKVTKSVDSGSREEPRIAPASVVAPAGLNVRSWEAVPISEIDVNDTAFQYRMSTEVPSLGLSLEREGQREPIDLGEGPPYRVIDGFRRVRAATELGWATVKAFIHHGLTDEEAYRIAFTKNVVRRNLSPLERAQAMVVAMRKRRIQKGELAATFGISEKQVKRYLDLMDFPKEIIEILDGQTVSMAHARALASFGVQEDACKWKDRIRNEGIDARTLVRLLSKEKGKKQLGRPRTYMRHVGNVLRVYSFTIGADASKDERDRVVRLLRDAVEFLDGLR